MVTKDARASTSKTAGMAKRVADALNALASDSFHQETVGDLQEFISDYFDDDVGDFSGIQ